MTRGATIGIDIGGSKTLFSLYDDRFRPLAVDIAYYWLDPRIQRGG